MAGNQENRSWTGPALIAGGIGIVIWKSLNPATRERIWRALENAAIEQERRRVASLVQIRLPESQVDLTSWPDIFGNPPFTLEPVVEAVPGETRFQAAVAKLQLPDPGDPIPETTSLIDRDRKRSDT